MRTIAKNVLFNIKSETPLPPSTPSINRKRKIDSNPSQTGHPLKKSPYLKQNDSLQSARNSGHITHTKNLHSIKPEKSEKYIELKEFIKKIKTIINKSKNKQKELEKLKKEHPQIFDEIEERQIIEKRKIIELIIKMQTAIKNTENTEELKTILEKLKEEYPQIFDETKK